MTKCLARIGLFSLCVTAACTGVRAGPGYVVYWGIGGDPTKDVGQKSSGVLSVAGVPLSNAVSVAVGISHGLVLSEDGTDVGWGGNRQGQATGIPSPWPGRGIGQVRINGDILSNVVAITAGGTHSLALKNDGSVVGWGTDSSSTPLHLAAGLQNS